MVNKDIATCNRCGWTWQIRVLSGLPKSCPNCKRYDWNEVKHNPDNQGQSPEFQTINQMTR